MFKHTVVNSFSVSFHKLFSKLTSYGFHHADSSALSFCQTVIGLLTSEAKHVDSAESLWLMWTELAHQLVKHVTKVLVLG